MQRVPYEGVSRMTTSMKRKHKDRIVRKGLAMMSTRTFFPRNSPLCTDVFELDCSLAFCVLLVSQSSRTCKHHPRRASTVFVLFALHV